MKATQQLHDLGQSLWLDNITRDLLNSGTLETLHRRAVGDRAHFESDDLRQGDPRTARLRRGHPALAAPGKSGEALFFALALADLSPCRRSVPAGVRADGRRGRLGVARGLAFACPRHQEHPRGGARPHKRAGKPNLFIKIPGTRRDCLPSRRRSSPACRSTSRCCSRASSIVAAAEAYMRGVERRIAAGLEPGRASVASLFVSRWDVAVGGKVPAELHQPAGHRRRPARLQGLSRIARVAPLAAAGERRRPRRSGCCWPAPAPRTRGRSDTLYVEGARRALHGQHHARGHAATPSPITARSAARCRRDGGDCEAVLAAFAKAGIDIDALAARLQDEGAKSFVKSWNDLMARIDSKSKALA